MASQSSRSGKLRGWLHLRQGECDGLLARHRGPLGPGVVELVWRERVTERRVGFLVLVKLAWGPLAVAALQR